MSTSFADFAKTALVAELEELCDAVVEVAQPLDEKQMWHKPIEPGNSVGHLLLHLTGNLNHFVGACLGKTGYVRNRDKEFTDANPPPKQEAIDGLRDAVATFRRVVEGLSEDELRADHPEKRFGSVYKALVHLVTHFALHRGQMSYLVRLLAKNADYAYSNSCA